MLDTSFPSWQGKTPVSLQIAPGLRAMNPRNRRTTSTWPTWAVGAAGAAVALAALFLPVAWVASPTPPDARTAFSSHASPDTDRGRFSIPIDAYKQLVQSWWGVAETLPARAARRVLMERRTEILAPRIARDYRIAPQAARWVVETAHLAADRSSVDPVLLLAVVAIESRFNPYAGSGSGALGLTQTLPSAHPEKVESLPNREHDILDPGHNLDLGATILREYLVRAGGDRMQALQRYHGSLGDPSQGYARSVLKIYHRLSSDLPAWPLPQPASPAFLAAR